MYIKFNSRSIVQDISIVGTKIQAHNLNFVQAQNLLLKLECDNDCLFDAQSAYIDYGFNKAHIGAAGGFVFGEVE